MRNHKCKLIVVKDRAKETASLVNDLWMTILQLSLGRKSSSLRSKGEKKTRQKKGKITNKSINRRVRSKSPISLRKKTRRCILPSSRTKYWVSTTPTYCTKSTTETKTLWRMTSTPRCRDNSTPRTSSRSRLNRGGMLSSVGINFWVTHHPSIQNSPFSSSTTRGPLSRNRTSLVFRGATPSRANLCFRVQPTFAPLIYHRNCVCLKTLPTQCQLVSLRTRTPCWAVQALLSTTLLVGLMRSLSLCLRRSPGKFQKFPTRSWTPHRFRTTST